MAIWHGNTIYNVSAPAIGGTCNLDLDLDLDLDLELDLTVVGWEFDVKE